MPQIKNLSSGALLSVLESVFAPRAEEKDLVFLVDLPGGTVADNPLWKDRRRIAAEWFVALRENAGGLPFSAVTFCIYENVGSNNADLPVRVQLVEKSSGEGMIGASQFIPLHEILEDAAVVLAPTEFSATAPLKILARKFGFRGATLPGFSRQMIPALCIDYEKVDARVRQIKERMDRADGALLRLDAFGKTYQLNLDLRFRAGHVSGGLIRESGTVANLPSGEAFIVPYEGERPDDPSRTHGDLPVQFGEEIVLFHVEQNRCKSVLSNGEESSLQAEKIAEDPAYGNIAELGIGVLGEWGFQPVGSTLLDEKLGLHVAFGRSEHFGGITGPESFRHPGNVVHVDWVYVPQSQPGIRIRELIFSYGDGSQETIMERGSLSV